MSDRKVNYGTYRFDPIIIGDYRISIQASSGHYSEPREDLYDAKDYDAFEVAILDKNGIVDPKNIQQFERCGWLKYFQYDEIFLQRPAEK